ncbi:rRNA 2'-O-methyltransferase fibrillarin 1-like isoform X1 [Daucus carota subsp. sativus]|uniref:rRNA 2'-O-methyltransferase fibrillarin 1-like isoform X1 n=1 Tax=Daucus carota subsp. sativus TaxID=79200 RepID=UPI0007EFCF56|nr:PREDICTED: probable mediator of RNA polymerase II transcription subunit 36b [Daucus carota subsp. sativus]XP_017221043.1 PREDICTED: probable mediator of RNA polymerase II transcription subunit 36b [Daucus carota subsp. sativus]
MAYIPAPSRKRKGDDCRELTLGEITRIRRGKVMPIHLLFECATGYALILARGITEVGMVKFESVEEYLNQSEQPFELESYLPFSSDENALIQMNAISKSLVTDQLQKFLEDALPQPKMGGSRYTVGVGDSMLGARIIRKTGLCVRSARLISDVMRGLRMKINQLIGLGHGELERAQLNLARLYNRTCTQKIIKRPILVSSFSSLKKQIKVVPFRFEGVFKTKGKDNMLCTKNLVPGEALYGEELMRVQNEGDITEVEYRVWNPFRSKLSAAIMYGVTNIWIKPGSRVLYLGNVCGLTVSNLSDLVGSDGMVYVVGYIDDVVGMAGTRPNVVTIIEKFWNHGNYRMLVSTVDVIFAEYDRHLDEYVAETLFMVNNVRFYLRAGGHYMISTRANNLNSTGQVKDVFTIHFQRKEFKQIETIMLNLMEGACSLVVGSYRLLDD